MTADARKLTRPELLPESVLIDVVKSRCIIAPDTKSMRKLELIEMYKRVGLPLPQRQYNSSKPLGKRLSDLRLHRKVAVRSEQASSNDRTPTASQNKAPAAAATAAGGGKSNDHRLNWFNQDETPKRTGILKTSTPLSTPVGNNTLDNGYKRKNCDNRETPQQQQQQNKKHKMISWP